jgi:hypothetical protein
MSLWFEFRLEPFPCILFLSVKKGETTVHTYTHNIIASNVWTKKEVLATRNGTGQHKIVSKDCF